MTQTTTAATSDAVEGPGPVLARHEATISHLALIHRKIATLEAARIEAETQLFYRMAQDIKDGLLVEGDLIDAYLEIKAAMPLTFAKRWDAYMPLSTNTIANRARVAVKYEKNSPGGRAWVGTRPVLSDAHTPRPGIAVIYVLYGEDNEPLYLGSSGNFRARISAHQRGPMPWVRYMATPCSDREAAYQLEEHYLRTRKPPMNRRTGR